MNRCRLCDEPIIAGAAPHACGAYPADPTICCDCALAVPRSKQRDRRSGSVPTREEFERSLAAKGYTDGYIRAAVAALYLPPRPASDNGRWP